MTQMIEPLGGKPLPTFTLTGVTTFAAHSIEAPFIIHWFELQAEMLIHPTMSSRDWKRIVRLLEAAHLVAETWITDVATKGRLARKLTFVRSQKASRR